MKAIKKTCVHCCPSHFLSLSHSTTVARAEPLSVCSRGGTEGAEFSILSERVRPLVATHPPTPPPSVAPMGREGLLGAGRLLHATGAATTTAPHKHIYIYISNNRKGRKRCCVDWRAVVSRAPKSDAPPSPLAHVSLFLLLHRGQKDAYPLCATGTRSESAVVLKASVCLSPFFFLLLLAVPLACLACCRGSDFAACPYMETHRLSCFSRLFCSLTLKGIRMYARVHSHRGT